MQVSDGDFTKTAASTVTVNVLKQGDQVLVGCTSGNDNIVITFQVNTAAARPSADQ